MPYDKHRMQDIKYSEKDYLAQYRQLWADKDINGINTLLQTNTQLKYKLFDAFNWNRLINLVNDQTSANAWSNTNTYKIYDIVSYDNYTWVSKQNDNLNNAPQISTNYWQRLNPVGETANATYDSLVGKWQIDYGNLKSITDNFIYVGNWAIGQEYKLGNLIKLDDKTTYFCLRNHTSSSENEPPNATYWILAEKMLDSVGIQVSATPPTNLTVGDIYFQIVG